MTVRRWVRCAGSGKSHVAKLIRDVEKEHNVSCRVHCLDDYFLTVRPRSRLARASLWHRP